MSPGLVLKIGLSFKLLIMIPHHPKLTCIGQMSSGSGQMPGWYAEVMFTCAYQLASICSLLSDQIQLHAQ